MTTEDQDKDSAEIEIRPEVTMLSVLKHLNYEPWFAIAEFVDNALQSFAVNETRLKALHGADFGLVVNVDIDTNGPGEIIVSDNAAGIFKADFPRAFRPAQPPIDRNGLSEFGMGMKSAACWFAENWSVRTKAIGESVERTIRFDVKHIVENNVQALQPEYQDMASDAHHTIVTLRKLHHTPKGRTVGKIKEH
ncbi:ATP-binding protein [Undibacterium sp. TC4M20W]|uniref:ATP-binding protein n=1 Tax=Undibacterium sp. TC4M20W TaxID=3413052 RepID=UPI003BF1A9E2